LPGYVSNDLIAVARIMTKPENRRENDVGYRARRLPFYMGKGAQEKHEIGIQFRECANHLGLKTDIETDEQCRIYGKRWYEFLANCRAVLGVEAGVSIFDLDDKIRIESERLISENPKISFQEISKKILQPLEEKIPYRMISPRHFAAAAFRVCQILFGGNYSGVMQPMVHYIPLKRDFSNFDGVIQMFRDQNLRSELTDNAYRDFIDSRKYSYHEFIKQFDQELLKIGFQGGKGDKVLNEKVSKILSRIRLGRRFVAKLKSLRQAPFQGRGVVKLVLGSTRE